MMNIVLLLASLVIRCCGLNATHGIEKRSHKNCPVLEKGTCPRADEITYWLSSSSSKGDQVQLKLETLQEAPFVKGPLKVWCPGYKSLHDSPLTMDVIKGYIPHGQYNVLVVDWNTYSKEGCYIQATKSISAVGQCTAQFLTKLLKAHPIDYVHVLGHSLGAHIAAWVSVGLPGLQRLTKLDAAMPLMTADLSNRGTAKFIDVYHCNTNLAGEKGPSGDVDVYFNTASFQPGCKCDITCSHIRCIPYFVESISKPMVAFPCNSWKDYFAGSCSNPKPTDLVNVGEGLDTETRGVFMVFTKPEAPYFEQRDVYTSHNIFESFKKILSQEECTLKKYSHLYQDLADGKL